MKRFLYILALILVAGNARAATVSPDLAQHLRDDTDYLACVLPNIPENQRQKVALMLWPAPVKGPADTACQSAASGLNAQEINELGATLERATTSCQTKLPSNSAARTDAVFGLVSVLLINPKNPSETAAWDSLMAASRACATAGTP
jgi:hypothetical protein